MVYVTPTVNEHVSKLFCDVEWWGDEVPSDQAQDLAVAHEMTPEHQLAEVDNREFELLDEAVRDQRGH